MYHMCCKQLYGDAKKEFDALLKDIKLPTYNNVCYALQKMAVTSLMKNIGTALKMNLCSLNLLSVFDKGRNPYVSFDVLRYVTRYNNTVLRHCLNLSSHELLNRVDHISTLKASAYDSTGELSKLEEVLVYLDSLPVEYYHCIYKHAIKKQENLI